MRARFPVPLLALSFIPNALTLCTAAAPEPAQSPGGLGTVEGRVTNAAAQAPLPGMFVVAVPLPIGSGRTLYGGWTDVDGAYFFDAPAGGYELRATRKGFQTGTRRITVIPGMTITEPFALEYAVKRAPSRCRCRPQPVRRVLTPDLQPTEDPGNHTAPAVSRLALPAPNPAPGRVRVGFDVGELTRVKVQVLDVQGRLVRGLADELLPPGSHEREWDGRSERGIRVATGTYFVRFHAGATVQTRKVLVLR